MSDPASYQSIGWLILTIAALAAAFNQSMGLVDRWRDKPPASEVAKDSAATYATKAEATRCRDELAGRVQRMEDARATDAKDAALSRRNLYVELKENEKQFASRLDELAREMQAMERRINSADETRTLALHARLNEILAEVSEMRGEANRKA